MGQHRLNAEVLCDHATPDQMSAFRMHMDLTFPVEDLGMLHGMLEDDHWEAFSDYFCRRYPQHRQLIETWCAGSARRRAQGRHGADAATMAAVV